jgi:hypothetical protein
VHAGVGDHPSVTVAAHAFRINSPQVPTSGEQTLKIHL